MRDAAIQILSLVVAFGMSALLAFSPNVVISLVILVVGFSLLYMILTTDEK